MSVRPAELRAAIARRRRERPHERDWRTRRAEYLLDAGRIDELQREGLEHALRPRRASADDEKRGGQQ